MQLVHTFFTDNTSVLHFFFHYHFFFYLTAFLSANCLSFFLPLASSKPIPLLFLSLCPPLGVAAVPNSSSFSIPFVAFCSSVLCLSKSLFWCYTNALLYGFSLQTLESVCHLNLKSSQCLLPDDPNPSLFSNLFLPLSLPVSPLCSLAAVRTYCSTLMTVLSGRLCTRGLKR